jgi:inosine/xanthosine triphosphate pyrophosphatase family protein
MLKRLLLGTRNPARIELVRLILRGRPVELVTLDELGVRDEVDEDGRSTAENAEKKARAYFHLSGIPTLAMDGGLRVERFPPGQQPGVLVRRQDGLGPGAGDEALLEFYRRALELVGGESPGTWTGSQALAVSNERVFVESFTFTVRFTTQRMGDPEPGLSLDPIMIDPLSGRYLREMPMEERPYYAPVAAFVRKWVEQ